MTHPKRPALLLLCVLAATVATGCATSASYKAGVYESYPVVASRLDAYDLASDERAAVAELRAAAAVEKAVTLERARPAWEAVEPTYRGRVAGDPTINEQRRADWLTTADLIDELQDAEAAYKASLGLSGQPERP